jgi:hypothetical protein
MQRLRRSSSAAMLANGVPGLPDAGFPAPARHILRCRHRRRSIRHRNDAKPSGAAVKPPGGVPA